ncbi:amidohydrolase [Corynebacterium yudongzhengii]|uniref:M20 family peptidase n=1 Tax=Corynebacterium yudongzhengii TaxID=2080740 RepID=A0A2U1T985_9CORY|nr:M20 family metallopeptidase [Corynebacterium yudongzhengii]AWB82045.1 amidohydrolase [Corynebacterium yudongzhengii]PWC02549.1 M20 family peptidase [Corynebacterium yudongzhengii]
MCENPQPSTAYLDYARAQVAEKVRASEANARHTPEREDYPGQHTAWEAVADKVTKLSEELTELADDLHTHPELAFEEFRSRDQIAKLVRRHGHEVTIGFHGVDTALRAEWQAPGFDPQRHPTIAVMSEYDALPGIGHACGHNLIAAAGVGAFLSSISTLDTGRVVLLGTPAEEGHSGKEYMIRGGMLEGVDAAVMMHPFSYDISEHVWVGRRVIKARFRGIAAHASSQPFMGRNALDAANLAYHGIGVLRQQMPPSDRMHAIISDGGQRPSVIPDAAEITLYLRSSLTEALKDLSSRIDDIFHGAALMAGVSVEVDWDVHPATLPIRNNHAMASRWSRTQARRGRTALPAGVVPETLAASTDFGNVSYLVPGIHPMVKIAPGSVALHTEAFETCARGEQARSAVVDSAIGLGQVIVDLIRDPELLAQAQQEFAAAGGALSVQNTFSYCRASTIGVWSSMARRTMPRCSTPRRTMISTSVPSFSCSPFAAVLICS